MTTKRLLLFSLLLYLLPFIAFGEEPADKKPVITDIYRLDYENESPPGRSVSSEEYNKERHTAGINDTVVIAITNLQALADQALCINQKNTNCKPQTINLYLNGKKITERDPNNGALGRKQDTIEFDLKYNASRDDLDENWADLKKLNWAGLLGSPPVFSGGFFQRPVKIAVGLDTGPILELNNGNFKLRRIDMAKFWICIGLLIIIGIIILRSHGIKQKIREALSDIGPPPASGFRTWSLARCQMAFWFVLVAVSFLSIWVVTGALDTITGSVLALIGIGSGTALGSAMIDVSTDSQSKLDELQQKEQKLNAEFLEVDNKAAAAVGSAREEFLKSLKTAIEGRLFSIRKQILKRSSIPISQSFWDDILNDQEGGAGFHRIQMVVWTLILGGIFVYSVWKTLSMPEFSETLLALQGLSAGTYLGFKIPDKKS